MAAKRWSSNGSAGLVVLVALASAFSGLTPLPGRVAPAVAATGCRIYVASGDDLPAGHDLDDQSRRFPERLLADHLKSPGWCLFNQGKNGTTSSNYITGGPLSSAYTMRPDFLTLTIGEQNTTIVNLITSCFEDVKAHDFAGALACAAAVQGDSSLWSGLTNNLTTIFQQYRIMMSQRPQLVVAVTNYPNPYPRSADVVGDIAELCVPLIDTIPTCTARWSQLPPALDALDQAFSKLNTTLKNALAPFQAGPNGSRFVYVDVYPKLASHCMKMEVTIKTQVEHPEEDGAVHEHDSPAVNFGCSDSWFVAGSEGTTEPDYLLPATIGVLIEWSQTTDGMGVYPNAAGHQCIADATWDADTIDPGVTPLKWKLGYGEASNTNIC